MTQRRDIFLVEVVTYICVMFNTGGPSCGCRGGLETTYQGAWVTQGFKSSKLEGESQSERERENLCSDAEAQ